MRLLLSWKAGKFIRGGFTLCMQGIAGLCLGKRTSIEPCIQIQEHFKGSVLGFRSGSLVETLSAPAHGHGAHAGSDCGWLCGVNSWLGGSVPLVILCYR